MPVSTERVEASALRAGVGGLPEYACSPEGEWRANAIYYKTLFPGE